MAGEKTSTTVDDFKDIRADARGTAKQKAKSALRNQNKTEWTVSITCMGDPDFYAGMTFDLEGWSIFDGTYIADSIKHSLSPDSYTCAIEAHRILEGY
ncbi:hypothetical protein AGMMS49992_30200 [Clostridia bacterium]|nr:hypothetical protein AGMMS49992_30200 [Clostridia bacterium]